LLELVRRFLASAFYLLFRES